MISDKRQSRDLGHRLGMIFLCFLISAWIHLVGFIIWQNLDKGAADSFYFELADQMPVMELNLVMNQPPPVEMSSEVLIPEPLEVAAPASDDAEAASDQSPDSAAPAPEGIDESLLNASLEAALQVAPLEVDESLARTELLPTVGNEEPAVVNPNPPVTLEGEAPDHKSYYTAIRRAVNNRWLIPPEAKNYFRPGRLTVDFTIAPDGALLVFSIVQSTGNAVLDHAGLEAIRSAAPFPPFPADFQKFSQLDIRMNFDYKAHYLPRKNE